MFETTKLRCFLKRRENLRRRMDTRFYLESQNWRVKHGSKFVWILMVLMLHSQLEFDESGKLPQHPCKCISFLCATISEPIFQFHSRITARSLEVGSFRSGRREVKVLEFSSKSPDVSIALKWAEKLLRYTNFSNHTLKNSSRSISVR